MTYTVPAFTEPAEPPKQEIKLEWREELHRKATVSLDQARELFGLGGTPDDELDWKVTVLAIRSPSMLSRLGPHVTEQHSYPTSLRKVNDCNPGDL